MGVAVKMGVAVSVSVGLSVGSSGVNVGRGVPDSSTTGTSDGADCVNPATMVCATMLPTAFWSGATETVGTAHAREPINSTVTDKRIGLNLGMLSSFRYTMQ